MIARCRCRWARYIAAETGDPAWSYESVLDIYRRIEDWQGPPDPRYRGTGGPVWVQPAANPSPVALAMVEAAAELGIPTFESPNGRMMEGPGGAAISDLLIRNGRRSSLFRAYVRPWLDRPNLTVLTDTLVRRVLFDGRRATGVELVRDGRIETIGAGREIVLSMEALQTPKVLMHSGIGDRAELARFSIPLVQHLPGVGRNFQDHVAFGCIWEYREPLAPRNSGSEATLYWKSRADLEAPDLLFCQLECPVPSNENATLGTPAHGWTMFAGLAHPASRGRLRLQSADPIAPLAIDANMLSDPADMQTALACVNLCRELGNASAFKHLVRGEAMPGDLSVEALTHYIRNAAVTYWHQTCTAKMGRDPMAVVDASLKVYGIKGLRVADGSVLPRLPTGNTQAPCAIIGERAAQMLTENGLLVPKPHIILLRRRSAARPHESLVSSGLRINKVNFRMEFFRLPIHRLRAAVASRAVDVSFTMIAEAREYRESVALSKKSPEEREKYAEHHELALDAKSLSRDNAEV